MFHARPNTEQMEDLLINRLKGGPAVYKPEIIIHAAREAQARRAGFLTVKEWENSRQRESAEWMEKFCRGEIE